MQRNVRLLFPFYSVSIESKVNTGTFDIAKILIFIKKSFFKKLISDELRELKLSWEFFGAKNGGEFAGYRIIS